MEATTAVPAGHTAYLALDVLVVQADLVTGHDGTVIAEAVLPEGASPPLHVHESLDDSFVVLEGRMVVRCGGADSLVGPGAWVPFPARVPHTFRVLDAPARVLMVHRDDSFLSFVRALGERVGTLEAVRVTAAVEPDDLAAAMARHGMAIVGGALEEDEARAVERRLAADLT